MSRSQYSKIGNYKFCWKIEKFSEQSDPLVSQDFTLKCLGDSKWYLDLYVYEYGPESRKFINILLNNKKDENEKDFLGEIDFTITILANDVSSNISRKSISNLFREAGNYNGFRRFVSLEELYAKRNVYFPDDILSVECYIEGKVDDSTIVREKEMAETHHQKSSCKFEKSETLQKTNCKVGNLGNDLLRLYVDSKFCDIEISTGDRIFSVHKGVICARSPVFNAMFVNDTKEKNSCVVDVTDVDSVAMNHLLTYMYSDVVEDMDPKEIENVYAAADKYEILPLKQHCSSTLKSLISDANLADIYTLADMHQDNDLKTAVEGYVFIYTKKVFQSSEWKKFMTLNPQLSTELMHSVCIKLFGN